MISSLNKNIGKYVEVHANGTTYRGILKGVGGDEIYLKSTIKTWQISMDRVRSVKVIDEEPTIKTLSGK